MDSERVILTSHSAMQCQFNACMALEQNHINLVLVNLSKSGIFAIYPKHNLGITETNKWMCGKHNCKEKTQF